MDAARFDRLPRSLSAAAPRRGLLAGISAALGLAAISPSGLRCGYGTFPFLRHW